MNTSRQAQKDKWHTVFKNWYTYKNTNKRKKATEGFVNCTCLDFRTFLWNYEGHYEMIYILLTFSLIYLIICCILYI